MSDTKEFPMSVVLTAYSDRYVCHSFSDVYRVLDWMTGDSNFTHQLPRVAKECKPWLKRWFPILDTITIPTYENPAEYSAWINKLDVDHAPLKVKRIPKDDHDRRNPIEEAVEMMGKDRVIVVQEPPHAR